MPNNVGEFWEGLSIAQKASVAGAVVLTIIAIVLLMSWAGRPDMQIAFTGLDPTDAAAMADQLNEDGIPYSLTDGGRTIKVPEEQIADARIGLASSGLPKGGTNGYELFDDQSFGTTDFTQRVNYRRALEGELSRTLSQMDEVSSARVHIALQQDSLFVEEDEPATAAIILKLNSGVLSPSKASAVSRLVAGSVEGLDSSNVTITDMAGNLLSGEDGGLNADANASGNQKAKQNYERQMESSLNQMLAVAFGSGKVVTKVTAEMDFDKTEETSTIYQSPEQATGGQGIITKQSTSTETFEGDGGTGATAGTPSNIPAQIAATGGDSGSSSFESNSTDTDFNVNRTDSITVKAIGTVTKQYVAVMVDGAVESGQVAQVEDLVKAGAGIDEARGDIVTVESIEFVETVNSGEAEAMAAEGRRALYTDFAKYGLLALGFILFFLFLMSRMRRSKDVSSVEEPFFQTPDALDSYQPTAMDAGPTLQIPGELKGSKDNQRSVEELVENRPDEAARLVRSWLKAGD